MGSVSNCSRTKERCFLCSLPYRSATAASFAFVILYFRHTLDTLKIGWFQFRVNYLRRNLSLRHCFSNIFIRIESFHARPQLLCFWFQHLFLTAWSVFPCRRSQALQRRPWSFLRKQFSPSLCLSVSEMNEVHLASPRCGVHDPLGAGQDSRGSGSSSTSGNNIC